MKLFSEPELEEIKKAAESIPLDKAPKLRADLGLLIKEAFRYIDFADKAIKIIDWRLAQNSGSWEEL